MKTQSAPLSLQQNSKGFSLIEVMIALGVFSIGILAVTSMQISAAQGNTSARLRTKAVTLSSFRLEALMAAPYGTITAGTETQGAYNLAWTVADDSPIADTQTITVTVTWNDRGVTQSTALNCIKANLN